MLDSWLLPLRHALGAEAVTLAWDAGLALGLDGAVELALAVEEGRPPRSKPRSDGSDRAFARLSPREWEVAALLARGLTNHQIAEQLVITERTVAAHIEHILNKLGFASRHQVGAWAATQAPPN